MTPTETIASESTDTISWRVNRSGKRFTVEKSVGGSGRWQVVFLCPTKTAALTVFAAVTSNLAVPAAGVWNWTKDMDQWAKFRHYPAPPRDMTTQDALALLRRERQVVASYDLWVGDKIRTYYFLIVGEDELLNSPLFDDEVTLARFYLVARAKQVIKGVWRYCYTRNGGKVHWSLALSEIPSRNMTACGNAPEAWVSSGFTELEGLLCSRCRRGRHDE